MISQTWSSLSKLGSGPSSKTSLPTLREDKCYHERKENMAGDAQQFWSSLSIHAASTAMGIGGGNESAMAAAESILDHGEQITHNGTPITSQTIRNAASKASIAILKENDANSRVASAVAVAVIQKGTALMQEMNGHNVDAQSSRTILTEISSHDNNSSRKSQRSRKSGNSASKGRSSNISIDNMKKMRRSELPENTLDDNNTIGSVSFKRWDKYATDLESPSEKGRNIKSQSKVTTNVVDKYASSSGNILEKWLSDGNDESSQASAEPSQYSTDQSTIATESYHCLGKHSRRTKDEDMLLPSYFTMTGALPSSYNITQNVESLAELGAKSSDLSSMRRKEEELERKHAEFSAAAEALEKKIAAAVAALEETESSSRRVNKLDNNVDSIKARRTTLGASSVDNVDSDKLKTPRMSNCGPLISTDNFEFAKSNSRRRTSKDADTSMKKADAHKSTMGESSERSPVESFSGKSSDFPSDLFLMTEGMVARTSRKSHDRCADSYSSFDRNEEEEEEEEISPLPNEVVCKKKLKDKVKGFLNSKTKKVTWAATNAIKTIPARSNSGIKSLRKVLRKRRGSKRQSSSRLLTGISGSLNKESRSGKNPKNEMEVKVVTFDDAALVEIPLNDTSSVYSARNSSALKRLSSPNARQFLDQAFYSQPDTSIDEETAVTMSTNNSGGHSSVEAILELDDTSRATSNYSSSFRSLKSGSTAGSSNLGIRTFM